MNPKLLLIDGHNILWRSWGVPFSFASSKGVPLQVVTGFLSYTRRCVEFLDATNILVVFDAQGKTDNHELSETYKSNRKIDYAEDEDSPYKHLPYVKKLLETLHIAHCEYAGHEADDVMATTATEFLQNNPKGEVYILSNDTDFYQIVGNGLKIIRLKAKKEVELIDENAVKAITGVTPAEYPAYKCLVGDSADNIKGVPGVGPVRAAKYINKTLDLDLEEYAEILELNMKLILLNREVPLNIDFKSLECDKDSLFKNSREIFDDCGF